MINLGTRLVAMGAVFLLSAAAAPAQAVDPQDEKAIFQKAEAFVEAFNKGNAKALAGFWTPEGIYRDQKGLDLKGRKAIEKSFESFFGQNKGLKLRINIEAMRAVTKDVIIEEGTTEVLHADGAPPSQAHYAMLHVKQDGEWFIDLVKDSVYTPPNNYKRLSALEWAIGNWADEGEKGNVGRLSFSWGPNQNFIVGSFATTFKNISLSSGTQWIAWDPNAKRIRSWTFDGSGSFGEAVWSSKGDSWSIKTETVLRDGKKVTATNVVTILDPNTITWQSTARNVDGKELPDTPLVKMKRVK